MKCKKCGKPFGSRVIIDGKLKNIGNRKYCLDCSPFGQHNTASLEVERNKNKVCKVCKKEFYSERYRNVCSSCQTSESRRNKKRKLVEYKGGKCEICGYNKCLTSLHFHHTNPDIKESGISGSGIGFEKAKKEVDKCILVCSNCHGEIHEGKIHAVLAEN